MDDLKMIPQRIKELRDILEISVDDISEKIGVSKDEYLKYESGEEDIPISILYEIASVLEVDFTVLLTGDAPRMNTQTVVRKGMGVKVDRYEGYSFSSLAYNFIDKIMEPMLVTLDPKEKEADLVSHGGQEFNYILSGKVKVTVGKRQHILLPGDCIYFNPIIPHGQAAVGEPSSFLTIITE